VFDGDRVGHAEHAWQDPNIRFCGMLFLKPVEVANQREPALFDPDLDLVSRNIIVRRNGAAGAPSNFVVAPHDDCGTRALRVADEGYTDTIVRLSSLRVLSPSTLRTLGRSFDPAAAGLGSEVFLDLAPQLLGAHFKTLDALPSLGNSIVVENSVDELGSEITQFCD
jgi:hypothetical protein